MHPEYVTEGKRKHCSVGLRSFLCDAKCLHMCCTFAGQKCVCLKRFLVHVTEQKLKLALAHNFSSLLDKETNAVCIFKKCKARFCPKRLFGASRLMFVLILLQSRGSQLLLMNFRPFGICLHQKFRFYTKNMFQCAKRIFQ